MEVLRAIGKSIGQISLYNKPEHPAVQALLQETEQKLSSLLSEKTPNLVYVMMGEQVVVNGRITGAASQIPKNLSAFFARQKLHSITFKKGVTVGELCILCAAAASRTGAAKTPVDLLVEKGIGNIALNEARLSVLMKGERAASGPVQPRVDERFVRTQFGRYLAPELVEKLAACPQDLKLGGETRTMTVLFADIRGFTTLAEGMPAQDVTRFINSFLTPMTRIILEHDGFIDKYIGDCVMAFWNAPLKDEEHAVKAGRAAIAMHARMAELNRVWEEEALQRKQEFKPVEIGIGLNTGECCVGNIGSEQRFEYSAIGDSVNLASRLEGQSKVYGIDILIGPETRKILSDFAVLELDILRVKGRTRPVPIFGLLGDPGLAKTKAFERLARQHAAFLESFRGRRWDEAEMLLGSCQVAGFPLQALSGLYMDRIAVYRRYPPVPDWDGVFTASGK
ncbi:MAG: adenylate/guanylate cyclase domain-containing protein [Elusimicrobiota bacterium]